MRGLTLKQEEFCQNFIIDRNGTQSAIRAGYSKRCAGNIANQLLKLDSVQNRINELTEQVKSLDLISVNYVVNGLMEVAERCLKPKPVMEWDSNLRCRVQKRNSDNEIVYEFDSAGANKAFELLGKYVGLFDQRIPGNVSNEGKNQLTDSQFERLLNAAIQRKNDTKMHVIL